VALLNAPAYASLLGTASSPSPIPHQKANKRVERTLGLLFKKLGVATDVPFTDRANRYEHPWYREYFRPR
jgi:hypothetical protein